MQDAELTRKRFIELGKKSENAPYFVFTDFLGLMEQAIFHEAKKEFRGAKYSFFGGADGTERIMIRFGDKEDFGYEEPFPIVTIKAEPLSVKFAENLTHRDYLGSILALGIERSTIGDIVIRGKTAYIFAKEDMADYIIDSLTKIRRTDVRLSRVEAIPEGELYKTERKTLQAVGERVDAVIAKLFGISRDAHPFQKGIRLRKRKAAPKRILRSKAGRAYQRSRSWQIYIPRIRNPHQKRKTQSAGRPVRIKTKNKKVASKYKEATFFSSIKV